MTTVIRNAGFTMSSALLASAAVAQLSLLTISGRLDVSLGHQRLANGLNMSFVTSDSSYISFQGQDGLGGGMSA